MSQIPVYSCGNKVSFAGSTFIGFGDSSFTAGIATESQVQTTWRTAGVFRNLRVNVTTGATTATTVTFRKNGANGNSTISVPTSTTGEFADVVNSDAIAAGDKINYAVTVSGVGTVSISQMACTYGTSGVPSNTVKKFVATNGTAADSSVSTTTFCNFCGQPGFNTTESAKQVELILAGTLKNFFLNVTANGRTSTTTVGTRINSITGNLTVSVGSGATGIFEDTTNSDTVTSTSLFNYYVTTGIGVGTLTISTIGCELITTNNTTSVVNSGNVGAVNKNLTVFTGFGGTANFFTGTESEAVISAQSAFLVSDLTINVANNTVSAGSTLAFRKNSGGGNNSISIPANTSGIFTDIFHVDSVAAGDRINYVLSTGATGTSLNPQTISATIFILPNDGMMLLGSGG